MELSEEYCTLADGFRCKYLLDWNARPARDGAVWVCSLRLVLGSWDKVRHSMEYRRDVQPCIKRTDCGFPE